jgi:hypothetical protein
VSNGEVAQFDQAFRTGETHFGKDIPVALATPAVPPQQRYFTFTYQAYYEEETIVGVSIFVNEVTDQVMARQPDQARAG